MVFPLRWFKSIFHQRIWVTHKVTKIWKGVGKRRWVQMRKLHIIPFLSLCENCILTVAKDYRELEAKSCFYQSCIFIKFLDLSLVSCKYLSWLFLHHFPAKFISDFKGLHIGIFLQDVWDSQCWFFYFPQLDKHFQMGNYDSMSWYLLFFWCKYTEWEGEWPTNTR